tara:strand:- start:221 stop:529 length:309 start_codon:yes stop_codon:yes gene_type:complete
MEKIERGTRNLEKLRRIANPKVGRGSVTFWNPTQAQKTTATLYSDDARLVAQLHDALNPENQARLISTIATLSGLHKILAMAWRNATFTSKVSIYDANGVQR